MHHYNQSSKYRFENGHPFKHYLMAAIIGGVPTLRLAL